MMTETKRVWLKDNLTIANFLSAIVVVLISAFFVTYTKDKGDMQDNIRFLTGRSQIYDVILIVQNPALTDWQKQTLLDLMTRGGNISKQTSKAEVK